MVGSMLFYVEMLKHTFELVFLLVLPAFDAKFLEEGQHILERNYVSLVVDRFEGWLHLAFGADEAGCAGVSGKDGLVELELLSNKP